MKTFSLLIIACAPLWTVRADSATNAPSATSAAVAEIRKTAETAIASGDDDALYQSMISQIRTFATHLRTNALTQSQSSGTRSAILEISEILDRARKAFDSVLDTKEARIKELSDNASTNAIANPRRAEVTARVVLAMKADSAILKTLQAKMADLDALLKSRLAELK